MNERHSPSHPAPERAGPTRSLGAARRLPWDAGVLRQSSLFGPLLPFSVRLSGLADFPSVAELGELAPVPVTFVEQAPRSRRSGRASAKAGYDARIALQRTVPTRPRCWHDLFNALVWCAFPRTKWALHARQHRLVELARAGIGPGVRPVRSAEGDALAMVDEGGALLWADATCHAEVERAIRRRDEALLGVFLDRGLARVWCVGHAVYEHLALGCRDVRASLLLMPPGEVPTTVDADAALAAMLERGVPRDRSDLGSAWIGTLERPGC